MGGGTVVSANTDHPKEAVEFLEAVNTDPKLMNLFTYGIKGKHYEKIGNDTIKWLDPIVTTRIRSICSVTTSICIIKKVLKQMNGKFWHNITRMQHHLQH